jgi:DNA polymerase-1
MTAPRQTLYLVDGSSNLYRSYYAIRGLTNSSGLATNAVYGFTTTLRKLIKDQKPDAMAVAFDVGSSTFRKELFADYKKDRKAMPDDPRLRGRRSHRLAGTHVARPRIQRRDRNFRQGLLSTGR